MSVLAMVPAVREALGVSSSYDDTDIPSLLRRSIKRLLRDYHFPKSVMRFEFAAPHLNEQSFTLPEGFKKDLAVQLYDPADGGSWSDPLFKREGFVRPQLDGVPRYYWLEGATLVLDTSLSGGRESFTLQLFAESTDVAAHEGWFTEDFEDVLFTYAVFRGAAEKRKPEVAQIYGPLWQDERTSLAIFLNELEFGNMEIMMHAPTQAPTDRYPIA